MKQKSRWREFGVILFGTLAYCVPLFWLWSSTGFPDDLGVHIAARGKTGLLENWWYSYLLLQRHQMMDVVTFAYMWAAVSSTVAWLGWAAVKDRRAKQMARSTDSMNEEGDAA